MSTIDVESAREALEQQKIKADEELLKKLDETKEVLMAERQRIRTQAKEMSIEINRLMTQTSNIKHRLNKKSRLQ